ncbi:AtpZ/AtpI family protein [Parabacteroides sp. FAFU027]|uniref:AtpZ/AtpI family protein n=1 Tax=Parabacteroides sp. FAFU027 TaxID=2922715 RepID=UPI001FAF58F8|nr:AtpZ/AtpI family protein [Parabacteroides sp. FAFU027]
MIPEEKQSTDSFTRKVGEKEQLKLKAQRGRKQSVWFGLSMFGLVGWSVVIPTLIGTAVGVWLDDSYPQSFSWTLTGLVCGLFLGCVLAWSWVSKERNEINDNKEEKKDE